MGAESGYRPVRPGTPLTANQINNNIVRGPQRGLKFSGNLDKRNRRDGVSVDLPDGGGQSPPSNYTRWAQVQAVYDDYLEVKMYNVVSSTTKGATFYAAKPYLNQITIFPDAAEIYEVDDLVVISRSTSNVVVSDTNLKWVVQGSGGGAGDDSTKSASTKSALAALMPTDGQRGYTTGTTKRYYVRIDGNMVCISHLE